MLSHLGQVREPSSFWFISYSLSLASKAMVCSVIVSMNFDRMESGPSTLLNPRNLLRFRAAGPCLSNSSGELLAGFNLFGDGLGLSVAVFFSLSTTFLLSASGSLRLLFRT